MTTIQEMIELCGNDRELRERLLSDPRHVLLENGISVPPNKKVEAIQILRNEVHIDLDSKARSPQMQVLLDKANSDPMFRRALLTDPKLQIKAAIGLELPSDFKVKFYESMPDVIRLFLPADDMVDELSELELSSVSGGGLFKRVFDVFCGDTTHTTLNSGEWKQRVDTSLGSGTVTSGDYAIW